MKAAQLPLVSIVTPFYNTAAYLDECIQSVLAQTYQNWEYLLVNNQSNDGSLEIAEKYARREARLRVITQKEFLGQADNYNSALGYISSESIYTKMVQADDALFPECVAAMVALAQDNPTVGIVSSYYLNGTDIRNVGLPLESAVVSGEEACRRHLLREEFLFGTPTTVMVRSSIIRSRSTYFDPASTMTDTEACYRVLKQWDFGFIHQVLSFARVHPNSITDRLSSMNPHLLDLLILTTKFGPDYLDGDELKANLAKVNGCYLRYMAKSVLQFRPSSFWQHHRTQLNRINYSLTAFRLLPYIVSVIIDALLRPKQLAEFVWKKLVRPAAEKPFSPKRPGVGCGGAQRGNPQPDMNVVELARSEKQYSELQR